MLQLFFKSKKLNHAYYNAPYLTYKLKGKLKFLRFEKIHQLQINHLKAPDNTGAFKKINASLN